MNNAGTNRQGRIMTASANNRHRKAGTRVMIALPALAVLALLGGCETATNAFSTVADKSKELWDSVKLPFSGEEEKSLNRDPTRERREDVEKWERIRGSDDPKVFQTFIETYPDSALTHLARRRLATLQPTQGAQVQGTFAVDQPKPPMVQQAAAGQMPPPAPPGQFPVPWVLGRWAIDCSRTEGGNGVTYNQVNAQKVRVIRDDGSSAVYDVRRENDVLVLEADGLIYQDKIVSATELRSYAVKYNNQWHKVDLVYRKCS
ncbi:MAG: hypothetical protein RIB80_18460 [Rhodospirillales bacterium]